MPGSPTFLHPGQLVVKRDGTEFVGRVVNVYFLPEGGERMDVQCVAPGARNLIHIYRPDQFRPMTGFEENRIQRMVEIWESNDG